MTTAMSAEQHDTVTITVEHHAAAEDLARAMVIEANNELGLDTAALVERVQDMSAQQAVTALRSCLWAYGSLGWPESIDRAAYRAALARAPELLGALRAP